jgi:hypothetical protein
MRRRSRVSLGKPGVKRNESGLDPESYKKQNEKQDIGMIPEKHPQCIKAHASCLPVQNKKCKHQEEHPDMHLNKVTDACFSLWLFPPHRK